MTNNEDDTKDLKIEFAPGCFDSFDGTQEELDELTASIKEMFASGQAQKLARPVDFDSIDPEDAEILERLANLDNTAQGRTLQRKHRLQHKVCC
jgi:hypothetical protein